MTTEYGHYVGMSVPERRTADALKQAAERGEIRCYHEMCHYPAVTDFRPVTGYDGKVRTFGACKLHRPSGGVR